MACRQQQDEPRPASLAPASSPADEQIEIEYVSAPMDLESMSFGGDSAPAPDEEEEEERFGGLGLGAPGGLGFSSNTVSPVNVCVRTALGSELWLVGLLHLERLASCWHSLDTLVPQWATMYSSICCMCAITDQCDCLQSHRSCTVRPSDIILDDNVLVANRITVLLFKPVVRVGNVGHTSVCKFWPSKDLECKLTHIRAVHTCAHTCKQD